MKLLANILTFLKKSWYYLVIVVLLVTIFFLYKKLIEPVPVQPNTNVIEQLRKSTDSLVTINRDLQIAYDNKQSTIINNITYKNAQDAKDISNIHNLTFYQRDSLWANHTATQDSLPWRYWDILKQKTGGRDIKEFVIQGSVQR